MRFQNMRRWIKQISDENFTMSIDHLLTGLKQKNIRGRRPAMKKEQPETIKGRKFPY